MIDKAKDALLEFAQSGQLVLFLGAGAIRESTIGPENKKPLLGKDVANELVKMVFGETEDTNDSLAKVCADIDRIYGRPRLRESLIDLLTPVHPSEGLRRIPLIRWAAIFTVNVDDSIERAYETVATRVQDLRPVALAEDVAANDIQIEISYYKLHGCLLKPESSLIFSHRDFTSAREKQLRLFSSLTTFLCEKPFVFIGFNLEDMDFNEIWESVKQYVGNVARTKPSFLVQPNPSSRTVQSLKVENVQVIDETANGFLAWLHDSISPHAPTVAGRVASRTAPMREWVHNHLRITISSELADKLRQSCEIVGELGVSSQEIARNRLLRGYQPTWADIQTNIPITRDLTGSLFDEIENWLAKPSPKIALLLGAAGYGKTTLLMQSAYRLSRARPDVVVLWLRFGARLNASAIAEFCQQSKIPTVLFIDDAFRYAGVLDRLHRDAVQNNLPLYLIVAARPADWNSRRGPDSANVPVVWKLDRLSEGEAQSLATLLRGSGILAERMAGLSDEDLVTHLVSVSESHLIAGLLTSISGDSKPFKELVAGEYFRIEDSAARNLYLGVALVHALGLRIPAVLAARRIGMRLDEYHARFGDLLDQIVLESTDDVYGDLHFSTQHRVIAETLIAEILVPSQAVEEIVAIAELVDPHDRNQYEILRRLYHEDYLNNLLKTAATVRSCYQILMEQFPSDAFIKQHAAIFESQEGNFDRADRLIEEAISIRGNNPHFINTKGTIWLRQAIAEKDVERAEYFLRRGSELIRERIARDTDKEIHYLSLIDKLLVWSRRTDLKEDQRLRVFEEIEGYLSDALRWYPQSSDMNTVAAKLSIALENLPDAASRLQRSIKLDSGNIRAKLLLARLFVRERQYDQALKLAEEGLDYDRNSAGLHKLKIECLEALNRPWRDRRRAIESYLRVVDGDYVQRIKLVKGLLEFDDRARAIEQIELLRRMDMPYFSRIRNTYDVSRAGTPVIVEGTYESGRLERGWVKVAGFPMHMGAFLNKQVLPKGMVLRDGQNIKFHLGVNGYGLVVRAISKS